ncbi:MAG: serine hydrolase domain-containing protein, partial [Bacteroidota bacterium]
GYTLLAEVVARVSGQSFAEFTRDRIFTPLGMHNSQFYDDHEKIVPNRAYSYERTGDHYKKRVLSFSITGSTSVFTTVEDIAAWALNFASPKVGSKAIFSKMETLAQLNDGSTFNGAYGLFINQHNGHKQIFHEGSDAGYRAYLARFPDQQLSIAVFSTLAQTDSEGLALDVANIFLDQQKARISNQPPPAPTFISLPQESLTSFTGNYWNQSRYLPRRIYLSKDTLRYFRNNGNENPIVPISDTSFKMLGLSADVRVKFAPHTPTDQMIVTVNNGSPIVFDKYSPAAYTPEELQAFTGEYYSEELDCFYRIKLVNDKLILHRARLEDTPLNPFKADLFLVNLWYLKEIKFVRDTANRITGLLVSGERVNKLSFKKGK